MMHLASMLPTDEWVAEMTEQEKQDEYRRLIADSPYTDAEIRDVLWPLSDGRRDKAD